MSTILNYLITRNEVILPNFNEGYTIEQFKQIIVNIQETSTNTNNYWSDKESCLFNFYNKFDSS